MFTGKTILEAAELDRKTRKICRVNVKVLISIHRSINGICCKKTCSSSKPKTVRKLIGKMRQKRSQKVKSRLMMSNIPLLGRILLLLKKVSRICRYNGNS